MVWVNPMMYGLGQPYDVWFRGKKIPSRFWWKFTLSKKFTTEKKLLGGGKITPHFENFNSDQRKR